MFIDPASQSHYEQLIEALREGDITAFIGAGASAPEKPAWKALHSTIQDHIPAYPRRPFAAEHAPADFSSFRDHMGERPFLSLIRDLFARPITYVPAIYLLLDNIAGISRIATTNFDTFLETVALQHTAVPAISSYPHFQPRDARYVYLHGRASTSRSSQDLILCEEEYVNAYTSDTGPKPLLRHLLTRPIMIAGYGMGDADIQLALRDLHRLRPATPTTSPPSLFIFRRAAADATVASLAVDTDRYLIRWGAGIIWYPHTPTHSHLTTLLLHLQHVLGARQNSTTFLDDSIRISQLGSLLAPTEADISEALSLLQVPQHAWNFYRTASSPAWLPILFEAGVLTAADPPLSDDAGFTRLVTWPAGPYVTRVASSYPDYLPTIFEYMATTTNRTVVTQLAHVAHTLPASAILPLLPFYASWSTHSDDFWGIVVHELSSVLHTLPPATPHTLASTVVWSLLDLMSDYDPFDRARFSRIVDASAIMALESPLKRIADTNLDESYPQYRLYAMARCVQLFGRMRSPNPSIFHRLIWNDNYSIDVVLNLVLACMRDLLIAMADHHAASRSLASEEVMAFLRDGDEPWLSLAMDVLAVRPEYLVAANDPVLPAQCLLHMDHYPAIALVLHRDHSYLPMSSQAILAKQLRTALAAIIEDVATDDVQSDYYRWLYIMLIPECYRTDNERNALGSLGLNRPSMEDHLTDLLQPDDDAEWWGEREVIDTSEFDALCRSSLTAAIAHLRDNNEWGQLKSTQALSASTWFSMGGHFDVPDFSHLSPYLIRAHNFLVDDVTDAMLSDLVALLGRIEESTHTTAHPHVLSACATLLRRLVGDHVHRLSYDGQITIARLCVHIIKFHALPLDGISIDISDLKHHDLNYPAGIAARILVELLRRNYTNDVTRNAVIDVLERGFLAPDAIDRCPWELRYAIGSYWILFLKEARLNVILSLDAMAPSPISPIHTTARIAFVHGFLHNPPHRVSELEDTLPLWVNLIDDLGSSSPEILTTTEIQESYCMTLLQAWLLDIPGYTMDDLIKLVFRSLPDPQRGVIIYRLATDVIPFRPDYHDAWKIKLLELWHDRHAEVVADPSSTTNSELASFFTIADVLDIAINEHLDWFIDGAFRLPASNTNRVLQFLESRAKQEPSAVAEILFIMTTRWQMPDHLPFLTYSRVRPLLRSLASQATVDRVRLRQIVNQLVLIGMVELMSDIDEWGIGPA